MAVIRAGNQADYAFKVDGLAANKLRVVQFVGSEGLSELFRFRLDLVSPDAELDFGAIVGQTALLTIQGPQGKRYIHGLVSEFELTAKGERLTSYRAEVVPMVWTLTHRADCRIFQNETIPDIIKTILEDAGLQANEQFRIKVSGSHQARDYCVQYRETDWSFVSRLMEQYGMFYFFEHTDKGHVLVVGDDASIHDAIPAPASVVYHEPGGPGARTDQEHISEFRYAQAVRSGKVTIDDFDFKKPSLELKSETSGDSGTELALYDYPGEHGTGDEGKSLAKRWLEEVQANRRIGAGESDCRRLIPGYRFTLDRYGRPEFNQDYLLLRVSHRGAQPQSVEAEGDGGEGVIYQNDFECIPATVPFRPPRHTRKPVIQGPQTAIVVGPSGEEIYTDEHGRVKVQFHWDRRSKGDEKSSCWIRVAQLWAGSGWGAMFIPRVKQEVIVEFLEGDPDRPIITGRVYNGEHMPPYKLPDEKTKSTIKTKSSKDKNGFNELRFEDKKDEEQIFIHGEKDVDIRVKNDTYELVGRDRHLIVKRDQIEHIENTRQEKVDSDHIEQIGKDRHLKVTGKEAIEIGGSQSLTVKGDVIEVFKANHSEQTKDDYYLKATNVVIEAMTNITLKVGSSFIAIEASGITIQTPATMEVKGLHVTVKADTTLELSGDAMTNVKSSGPTMVKGAIVMIN